MCLGSNDLPLFTFLFARFIEFINIIFGECYYSYFSYNYKDVNLKWSAE